MSEPSAVASEVRELLLRILRLPAQTPGDLVRAHVEQWDSLKHMEIVFALEDRYGVQFDESEFQALDSPTAIAAALQRHLAA
jgi:acyl carrier protein